MNRFVTKMRRWSKTIRGRLTLWFVSALLSTFIIFLIITAFIFSQVLNNQIDHHLHTVIGEVERIWHQAPEGRYQLIQGLVSSNAMVVMVLAPDGQMLFQTASSDITIPAQHEIQQRILISKNQEGNGPHHFNIDNIRFALVSTEIIPGEGVIAVGYSAAVLQDALKQSLTTLGSLIILFIIPLGFMGYLLASKALDPVTTITKSAQAITKSGSLNSRIPKSSTDDELAHLTEVLNLMLMRLQRTFESQKQFFADAAHTLKTPLTAIRTNLERIGETDSLKEIDRASVIVKDLLLLSQIESQDNTRKDKIDISRVLNEIIEISKTLSYEKSIKMNSQISEGLVVSGDKSKLRRAILNIVENAINYTKPKDKIKIIAEKKDTHVVIKIIDTGIGISKSNLHKVFNRFYRGSNAKNLASGSGLGLAIAKAVIEAHEGEIKIVSVVGKGTTVTISFPSA